MGRYQALSACIRSWVPLTKAHEPCLPTLTCAGMTTKDGRLAGHIWLHVVRAAPDDRV